MRARLVVLSVVVTMVAACGTVSSTGGSRAATPSPLPSTGSPAPSPTVGPSIVGRSTAPAPSPSASPSPTPTLPLPSGSVPPISTAPWTGLRLGPLKGGPLSASSVVAWSGGYLALGQPTGISPLPAWVSRNGRSWVQLPTDTFPAASSTLAAPWADGIVVAIESATGDRTIWRSTDGVTWTSSPLSQMRVARDSDLAGSPRGTVAVLDGPPSRLSFTRDGAAWRTMSLPGSPALRVQGVAALADGFVAVGDAGANDAGRTPESPVAWWSADGVHWNLAAVQAHPGDGFYSAQAGRSGLVASSTTVGAVPGLGSFWTSPDGRSWKVSAADPLDVFGEGEGMGSAAGDFSGDGTRLLGYGTRAAGGPPEYWVSFDANHWTRLALTGDSAAAAAGQTAPFLLRDGVLFSGEHGSWFGTASHG